MISFKLRGREIKKEDIIYIPGIITCRVDRIFYGYSEMSSFIYLQVLSIRCGKEKYEKKFGKHFEYYPQSLKMNMPALRNFDFQHKPEDNGNFSRIFQKDTKVNVQEFSGDKYRAKVVQVIEDTVLVAITEPISDNIKEEWDSDFPMLRLLTREDRIQII